MLRHRMLCSLFCYAGLVTGLPALCSEQDPQPPHQDQGVFPVPRDLAGERGHPGAHSRTNQQAGMSGPTNPPAPMSEDARFRQRLYETGQFGYGGGIYSGYLHQDMFPYVVPYAPLLPYGSILPTPPWYGYGGYGPGTGAYQNWRGPLYTPSFGGNLPFPVPPQPRLPGRRF